VEDTMGDTYNLNYLKISYLFTMRLKFLGFLDLSFFSVNVFN